LAWIRFALLKLPATVVPLIEAVPTLMSSELPEVPPARIVPWFTKLPRASIVEARIVPGEMLAVIRLAESSDGLPWVTRLSPAKLRSPPARNTVSDRNRPSPASTVPFVPIIAVSPACGTPVGDQSVDMVPDAAMPAGPIQV
jgi:hypothetical protein